MGPTLLSAAPCCGTASNSPCMGRARAETPPTAPGAPPQVPASEEIPRARGVAAREVAGRDTAGCACALGSYGARVSALAHPGQGTGAGALRAVAWGYDSGAGSRAASAAMSGPGLVAGEVAVDALPYFDQGYEAPGVREAAAALVEEETRRYRPTKNYLSYLPTPDYSAFETEIMRNEFERLAARQPIELLSMKRYELPAPSSGQKNDITAWQECVNNSMAQLEHQAVRIENLELMSQHGCNAWKVYNEHLVHMIEQAQKELQKLRKNIQDLNWQRKNMQLTAGSKLREMESTWVSLVSKNYEIERTIVQLENEILQIKQQHGEANKENIEQDF